MATLTSLLLLPSSRAAAQEKKGTLVFRWRGAQKTTWEAKRQGDFRPAVTLYCEDKEVSRDLDPGTYTVTGKDFNGGRDNNPGFEPITVTIYSGKTTSLSPRVSTVTFRGDKTWTLDRRRWSLSTPRGNTVFSITNQDIGDPEAVYGIRKGTYTADVPPGTYIARFYDPIKDKVLKEKRFTLIVDENEVVDPPRG